MTTPRELLTRFSADDLNLELLERSIEEADAKLARHRKHLQRMVEKQMLRRMELNRVHSRRHQRSTAVAAESEGLS